MKTIILLFIPILFVGCNTIPINAKACYVDPKTGLKACATYGPGGLGVEADYKSVK